MQYHVTLFPRPAISGSVEKIKTKRAKETKQALVSRSIIFWRHGIPHACSIMSEMLNTFLNQNSPNQYIQSIYQRLYADYGSYNLCTVPLN